MGQRQAGSNMMQRQACKEGGGWARCGKMGQGQNVLVQRGDRAAPMVSLTASAANSANVCWPLGQCYTLVLTQGMHEDVTRGAQSMGCNDRNVWGQARRIPCAHLCDLAECEAENLWHAPGGWEQAPHLLALLKAALHV